MEFIQQMYMPIVLVACLCIGYVIKKWLPTDDKWIPTIMLILGAILGCVAMQQITLDALVSGGVSGLASTGMHQLFKQLIEDGKVATVLTEEEVDLMTEDESDDMEQEK